MNPPAKRQRPDSNGNTTPTSQPLEDTETRLARLEQGLHSLTARAMSATYHGSQIVVNHHNYLSPNQPGHQAISQVIPTPQPGSEAPLQSGPPPQYHQSQQPNPPELSLPSPKHNIVHPVPDPYQLIGGTPTSQQQPTENHARATAAMPPVLPPRLYRSRLLSPDVILPTPQQLLAGLSESDLRALLSAVLPLESTGLVESMVIDHYIEGKAREQARIISFDSYSKTAWHAINTKYSRLSGSKQYERSWDVTEEVMGCVGAIRNQVKASSSFGTKLNALETLRKIAKTILLSNDTLGHEVRKQFQSEYGLVETIVEILEGMSREERLAAGRNISEEGKGTLLSNMEWVHTRAEGLAIAGLDVSQAISLLRARSSANENPVIDSQQQVATVQQEQADVDAEGGPWDFESFESCAATFNHIINESYSDLSGSKQYEKSGDALREVQAEIKLISEKISRPLSLDSKGKALIALIEIGRCVIGSEGNVIAHEIRKDYQRDTQISKLICSVISSVPSQRRTELFEKIKLETLIHDLVDEAQAYGINCFDGLRDVLKG